MHIELSRNFKGSVAGWKFCNDDDDNDDDDNDDNDDGDNDNDDDSNDDNED